VFMATDLPGILIVDDNEDNRYTLQLLLESDGHGRIVNAASGNDAIALIEKEKFSLVLLDLMMPDVNGDEVLKAISPLSRRRAWGLMLTPCAPPLQISAMSRAATS
jgi:CheY-like chemotaxis protein